MNSKYTAESRKGYWRRILRPLYWWVVLVLVLYGIRLHQRTMEQTRINFTVSLQWKNTGFEATPRLDGKPVVNGEKISLGRHTFTVTHPKAVTFSTNFFGWYGGRDFGQICLQRTMGTLKISASPPAQTITITGPEFSATLTNCAVTNLTVPTDAYTVLAEYLHWSQSQDASVFAYQTAACTFSPRFGAVEASCNKADAAGQLVFPDGQVETFTFPYSAVDLPEGNYKFVARHSGDEILQTVSIAVGNTNTLTLNFVYGSLSLETEPSGAMVRTTNGQYWGITPIKLVEVKPASLTLNLQHNGYESATVSLVVAADQVTSFQTNLVAIKNTVSSSESQLAATASASTISSPPSENLVMVPVVAPVAQRPATETAVKPKEVVIPKPVNAEPVKPSASAVNQTSDAEAQVEQSQAAGLRSLQRARMLASQGNYAGALKTLSVTVKLIPDNQEAKSLLAECQQQAESKAKPVAEHGKNRPKKPRHSK